MVVFTCQHCGESVKKNAADNHRFKCSRDLYLTCVDCLKDFRQDEYKAHISCVTEAEKYGGKNYVAKPVALKQNEWLQICQSVLQSDKLSQKQRRLLELCSGFNNVPRNENKFVNFIRNVGQDMRYDIELAKSVFAVINGAYKKQKEASKNNKENQKDGVAENKSSDGGATNENYNGGEGGEADEAKRKTKKDKKKKKGTEEEDNLEKGNVANDAKLSKKEQKRLKKLAQQNEECETENANGSAHNENLSKKEKKKKNKSLSQNGSSTEDSNGLDATAPPERPEDMEKEDNAEDKVPPSDQYAGLTKKERKRKMKQDKYEAEMRSIENYQREREENGNDSEEGVSKRKKKKTDVGKDEFEMNDRNAEKQKKSIKEDTCEDNGSLEADVPTGKFDWGATIMKLLEASSDGEMSLKRLCKKVVAEHQFQKGSRDSYEKVVAKFNKKIQKTVGVRVIKDHAKLILNGDQGQ